MPPPSLTPRVVARAPPAPSNGTPIAAPSSDRRPIRGILRILDSSHFHIKSSTVAGHGHSQRAIAGSSLLIGNGKPEPAMTALRKPLFGNFGNFFDTMHA